MVRTDGGEEIVRVRCGCVYESVVDVFRCGRKNGEIKLRTVMFLTSGWKRGDLLYVPVSDLSSSRPKSRVFLSTTERSWVVDTD